MPENRQTDIQLITIGLLGIIAITFKQSMSASNKLYVLCLTPTLLVVSHSVITYSMPNLKDKSSIILFTACRIIQ